MTSEGKKAWLRRYLVYMRMVEAVREKMEVLEAQYMLPSITIDDKPHGRSGEKDLSLFAAQWDALYEKLKSHIATAISLHAEIMDAIETSDMGNTAKALLIYRYINGNTFEQIADKLGYSYRHTTRLHGTALYKLKVPESMPKRCP